MYIGEYAATGRNNLYSSLAEAAFLTGVERNGDKVQLVSYAPLLQNAHYGKGHLIVYDGKQTYGRSNYHLLKAFAENRPDVNVNTVIRGEDTAVPFAPHGFIGLGTAMRLRSSAIYGLNPVVNWYIPLNVMVLTADGVR